MKYVLIYLYLLELAKVLCTDVNMKIVSQWKMLDFNFPTAQHRQFALLQGSFVPGNAVPIDVDVHYNANGGKSRVFVTFPRFRQGIPFTIGTLSTQKSADGGSLIEPYPSYFPWHSNPGANCDGITSVFRIAVSSIYLLINSYFPLDQKIVN